LKAKANEPFSMHAKVPGILIRHRETPLSNNKTPSEMYLQRNIRIQIDAIRPMKHIQNTNHAVESKQLSAGEREQTRCYIKNQAVWKLATIIQKFGKLHYQVKIDDGYTVRSMIEETWRQLRADTTFFTDFCCN
jgi:hypothetical protein